MTRRLVLSYLGLALLILVLLEIPMALLAARHEHDQTVGQAGREASGLAAVANDDVEHGRLADLSALMARYQSGTGEEIAIVNPAGQVDRVLGSRPRRRRYRRPTLARASCPVRAVGQLIFH